jgi:hypothetical protein
MNVRKAFGSSGNLRSNMKLLDEMGVEMRSWILESSACRPRLIFIRALHGVRNRKNEGK